jgi:chaperonin cofactor prefoldin
MADKTSMGALLAFAKDVDVKHDKGHGRLRLDLDRAEERIHALETCQKTLEVEFTKVTSALKATENAPIDVGKIMFNPRMVLGIIGLVASIITGNWLTNQPIRDQLVRSDERQKAMEDKIDTLQRQMEMRRLEIQGVSNDVQQLRRDK